MVKKDNIKKFTIIQLGNGDNGKKSNPRPLETVRLGLPRSSFRRLNLESNPPRIVRLNRRLNLENNEQVDDFNKSGRDDGAAAGAGDSKESNPIKNKFMEIVISKEKIAQESIITPNTESNKIFILPNKIIKFFSKYEIYYLQQIKENLETNDNLKNFLPIYKIDQMYKVDGINYYYVKIEKFGVALNKKLSKLSSNYNYQGAINLREKSFTIVRNLLKYLHSKNLYHGDLITSDGRINDGNILVNDILEFKIIDFGKVDINKQDALIIKEEKDGLIKMENNTSYRRQINVWNSKMNNKRRRITMNDSDSDFF